MSIGRKISLLNKAVREFEVLGRKARYKARIYQFLDILIKVVLSFLGATIAYLSKNDDTNYSLPTQIIGIFIASLTAISSLFTFEKRSHCNIQVYSKCQSVIPEIEDKIDSLRNGENQDEDIHQYIKKIFKDLSSLSLASFTDAIFEKIASRRSLE